MSQNILTDERGGSATSQGGAKQGASLRTWPRANWGCCQGKTRIIKSNIIHTKVLSCKVLKISNSFIKIFNISLNFEILEVINVFFFLQFL